MLLELRIENLLLIERAELRPGSGLCAITGETVTIRFQERQALLAQIPGATFYHRLRDKFGRLAY